MRSLWYPLVCAFLLVGALLMGADRAARALPPAGSDLLPVVVTVDAVSRLGEETVALTGWVLVDRQAPRTEGGVEVVDLEIVSLELQGASQIGAISVVERPNDGSAYVSGGEIRSLQAGQDFPASGFFDLFVDVTVPASPLGELELHNELPLRLTPREAGQEVALAAWPPLGVAYELEPISGVDNDGDTLIDEDTADDDGDGLIDEDRPGPDPDTPGTGSECGDNADCDDSEGEDPPIDLCGDPDPPVCDEDGDGLIDEDPACIPLLNPGNTHMKAGYCIRNIALEFAPELPSYSVARGGPSSLHPADILALMPASVSGPPPTPTPVAVTGNDDFADAWAVPSLPFVGEQSTAEATLETVNTGLLSPTAQSAVAGAGDGDGFESSPENAFADDTDFAEDVDSGTDVSTSCADPDPQGKDRHIFRDFDIPSVSRVWGIDVRLDAWADSSVGDPRMCVQLSGDGGDTWSATRETDVLTTSEDTYQLGGPLDRWRLLFFPWSLDELTNDNFRLRITNVAGDTQRAFSLDWVAIRFHETVEPQRCGAISNTVWYSFTPSASATVTASTSGSNFDTVLAAYTGSDVYALTNLVCNDDFNGPQSQISFSVDAGVTYYLQAGGRLGATGDLALNVSQRGAPGDQAPFVHIPCANLGLTADGCDDGADGDQDDLDALSYGDDLPPGAPPGLHFSVGPGAQGVAGSAVEEQRNCPPAQPGTSPEPEPDEFGSLFDGTNFHVLDGNGPVGACSPAFPLGLIESAFERDDLDALDRRDGSAVDEDADGVPDSPVYFSLDAASPSLGVLGFSAADVLKTVGGGEATVYASAAELGLEPGDDLDALCLRESGDGEYGADDALYFSLAPGSPSLAALGASPADVLGPGPVVLLAPAALGLQEGDDVNAMRCFSEPEALGPVGDVSCDGNVNSIDAALMLQIEAGLLSVLPCPQNADVNGDGAVNSIDAALILQFDAGLIDSLPPDV